MMSNSITLVSGERFCSFCEGGIQAVARLYWRDIFSEQEDILYICLPCLLKAVGLLETELEAESETIEVEEFYGVPEGLLSPPIVVELTKKGGQE